MQWRLEVGFWDSDSELEFWSGGWRMGTTLGGG